MKKLVFLFAFALLASAAVAQKYAYIDSKYIMENVPEFQKAQKEIDQLSTQWQKELEGKYKKIEELYKTYQAEQVLLTDEMRKNRENEIIQSEQQAQLFQEEKFGVEGELFKKRKELIQPIQERIYEAIKELATSGGYDMVLDKSEQTAILYINDRLDKSDSVLRKMGIKKGVN